MGTTLWLQTLTLCQWQEDWLHVKSFWVNSFCIWTKSVCRFAPNTHNSSYCVGIVASPTGNFIVMWERLGITIQKLQRLLLVPKVISSSFSWLHRGSIMIHSIVLLIVLDPIMCRVLIEFMWKNINIGNPSVSLSPTFI